MKEFCRLLCLYLLISATVCFASCKKKIATKADLISYINDSKNGLQKSQQMGEINAVLTYKPFQLMTNMQRPGSKKTDMADKFQDKLFFVLSLSANNKELLKQLPFSQYSEMVQVMAFRMNSFIDVVPDNNKPVEPLDCIFQQTYGMGASNNLLIVFDKKRLMTAQNLRVHITEFGLNTGDLNFEIAMNDIKTVQNIVLN
jgi:hypothetical protein